MELSAYVLLLYLGGEPKALTVYESQLECLGASRALVNRAIGVHPKLKLECKAVTITDAPALPLPDRNPNKEELK